MSDLLPGIDLPVQPAPALVAKSGLPYFYATVIAKALVGDKPCLLEPWLKSRFEIQKRERGAHFAKWKVDHTAMMETEIAILKAAGWRLRVEQYFRLTGKQAVLGGKPDIIAQQINKRPMVIDCKSGVPRDSDVTQVQIYMIAIPLVWGAPEIIFNGEVAYIDHRVPVPAGSLDAIRPRVFAMLRQLAAETRPDAVPSEGACRFCDITKTDCPERWDEGSQAVLTSEF